MFSSIADKNESTVQHLHFVDDAYSDEDTKFGHSCLFLKKASHPILLFLFQCIFPTLIYPFVLRLLDSSQQLRRRLLSVSLGVVADPPPEVLAGLFHGELSLPLQLLVGQLGVGSQVQDITGSASNDLVLQVSADDVAESLDDLKDGATTAGTQVPGLDTGLLGAEIVEGLQVASSKIHNVNVVSDGGSVTGGVVCRIIRASREKTSIEAGTHPRQRPATSRAGQWQPVLAREAG